MSQLRKVVGDDWSRDGAGYSLQVEPDELDAARFERLAGEAAAALGRSAYGEASRAADEALGLWRGPALADVQYEAFAQPEILRLDELRLAAIEGRIEATLGLGRHDQVIGELEALVAEHPARERLRAPADARALPQRAGRLTRSRPTRGRARCLLDELGLEPGPELRELEQAILRQDEVALAGGRCPQGNVPTPVSTLVGSRP